MGITQAGTPQSISKTDLKDLAPDVFRQRLLIEGFYGGQMTEARVRDVLIELAEALDLRTYAEPIVFQPASGMGQEQNAGFDAFVPLIDSGISAYFWTGPGFFSLLLYTCKGFDMDAAVAFTRDDFGIEGDVATHAF